VHIKLGKVHLYWDNSEKFLLELQELLGELELSEYSKSLILEKLANFEAGLLRYRKDYKPLVGYQSHGLWELRVSLNQGNQEIKTRLICSSLGRANSVALRWHVKQPALSLTDQRRLQNLDCEIAIQRMRRETID
jgi:hypothetical protein